MSDGNSDFLDDQRFDQRISFGPKEWQSLQPEVASMMLTLFKQRQPALFGAYLAEVMTDTKPKAARGD